MELYNSGIQQIGIGVTDADEAWKWYKEIFNVDVVIIDEYAKAEYMLPYTDGQVCDRHTILAVSLQGGGGFEIWQHRSHTPTLPAFEVKPGDLGIFACKIKCKNASQAYRYYKQRNIRLSSMYASVSGKQYFYLHDPYGNVFQVVECDDFFHPSWHPSGGAYGAVVGVSDMTRSISFYRNLLGYDLVLSDQTGEFDDLAYLGAGGNTFRRVVLTHSKPRIGAFSRLFGTSQIELLQVKDREPRKIYEGRWWGDPGFIHLCFDIRGMQEMRERCKKEGYPFTVDTESILADNFDMGEAAGNFAYNEDPDGTLIEYVETHRIPIMQKWGVFLNLRKRKPGKALPDWMLRCLRFMRR